jgi:hypothetical protein
MVAEDGSKRLYMNERSFELLDIPKEMLKSIARALQAPFYALAFMIAGLCSLVNPMMGRKLGSEIERDWNDEMSLSEGFWSVGGPMELFSCEGGGGPLGLGRNGFFLAGCWQPVGIAEFNDGVLQEGYGLAHAVDSTQEDKLTLLSYSDLNDYLNKNQNEIEVVKQKFKSLNEEISKRKASIFTIS